MNKNIKKGRKRCITCFNPKSNLCLFSCCVFWASENIFTRSEIDQCDNFIQKKENNDIEKANIFDEVQCDDALSDKFCNRNENDINGESSICRYYLAPSSIPNSGWGVYTVVDIVKDEVVFQPEIVIPLIDVSLHNGNEFGWLHDSYTWEASTPGFEHEAFNVDAWIPGAGSMANHYSDLINVVIAEHSTYDDSGLDRSNPGAGAFSYHIYDKVRASGDIVAGSELFVDYGEQWWKERVREYGLIPMAKDYRLVDTILQRFMNLRRISKMLSREATFELWDLTKLISTYDTRTINAFKVTDVKDLDVIHEVGTARYSLPNSQTSVASIKENGMCIDHLHPAKSNIPGAGMGAFSAQFFRINDVIAPLPLIHIAYNNTVEMYEFNRTKGYWNIKRSKIIGKQLLLNYCYSHKHSTVLLCPYGSAVNFVNHDSKSPNMKIRWSNFTGTRNDWLDIPVEELNKQKKASLMFEFVAIRDIAPGEEFTIDYGKDWEEAWNSHVESFSSPPGSHNYTSAYRLSNDAIIRTTKEQKDNPYSSNMQIFCIYRNVWTNRPLKYKGEIYIRPYLKDEGITGVIRPCEIVDRKKKDGKYFYTAIMLNEIDTTEIHKIPAGEVHKVTRIPREFISVKDKRYTSDIHMENAFRHPIGIPDEIFPSAWKNIKDD